MVTYKSLTTDLRVLRNALQNNSTNPYVDSSQYTDTEKYVLLHILGPAGANPTAAEYQDRSDKINKPLIVQIHNIIAPPRDGHAGSVDALRVMIRCFVRVNTKWKFKGVELGAESMAYEKINEILFDIQYGETTRAALQAVGISYETHGGIRPATEQDRADFGAVVEVSFKRRNVS